MTQRISYAKNPSNATLARSDPSASRDAAKIAAAKLVVSRAQGEYEQLEKEREKDGKREADDGGEAGRESKRLKGEDGGDDEEMEIEMEDDEDGTFLPYDGEGEGAESGSAAEGEWEWEGEIGVYEFAAGMYGGDHGRSFLPVCPSRSLAEEA